jgi:hypothetical protein
VLNKCTGEAYMDKKYTEINSKVIDKWVEEGWEWG